MAIKQTYINNKTKPKCPRYKSIIKIKQTINKKDKNQITVWFANETQKRRFPACKTEETEKKDSRKEIQYWFFHKRKNNKSSKNKYRKDTKLMAQITKKRVQMWCSIFRYKFKFAINNKKDVNPIPCKRYFYFYFIIFETNL